MIRRRTACLAVAAGLTWVACGGSTVSNDSSGAGGGTTGATTSGSGGTTAGSGGNGGSGGPSEDAGNDAPASCPGTVTFQLTAENGRSADWCVGSNCGDVWVTVTSATGK